MYQAKYMIEIDSNRRAKKSNLVAKFNFEKEVNIKNRNKIERRIKNLEGFKTLETGHIVIKNDPFHLGFKVINSSFSACDFPLISRKQLTSFDDYVLKGTIDENVQGYLNALIIIEDKPGFYDY